MFDTDLYHRLAAEKGNLCCSPYSIASALAMVASGAGGRTKEELTRTLGAPDPAATYGALGQELARRSQPTPFQLRTLNYMEGATPDVFGCHLTVANALWHQKGYALAPAFVQALRTKQGAQVGEADFQGAPALAAKAVNAWVAAATRDKIREVLTERQIDPMTRVILANAIYFKARWETEFSEYGTQPAPFRLADGKRVDVPTMQSLGSRATSRDGGLQALLLPYSGAALAMLVLLPDAGTLERAEQELDGARIERLLGSMKTAMTEVALPKFKVESSFALGSPLQAIGLGSAFGPAADFTGVSSEPGFAISEVLHKTFIDVNEKGTEAAAVTMPMMAGSAPPKKTVEFKVDRPFLFLIRDLPTRTTLFMGRVVDPRGSG
ncbi:MAG TPA: serpin family protein [Planctomycetota bacterium]|nr:serpin family protein [Planctomycetota bacterium]